MLSFNQSLGTVKMIAGGRRFLRRLKKNQAKLECSHEVNC